MSSYIACIGRSFMKEEDGSKEAEEWLTQQLKLTREELHKRSQREDEMTVRLKDLEDDLKKRSSDWKRVQERLNTTKSELRAAGRDREQHVAENAKLSGLVESLQKEAANLRVHESSSSTQVAHLQAELTGMREAELAQEREAVELRKQLAQQELAAQQDSSCLEADLDLKAYLKSFELDLSHPGLESVHCDADVAAGGECLTPAQDKGKKGTEHFVLAGNNCTERSCMEKLRFETGLLRKALLAAQAREAELQQQLMQERNLNVEANKTNSKGLEVELNSLSCVLEQKEEDILNIKFDMVELQNRLADQARLVSENADAFQQASEELAEKDERLSDALARQEELLSQMNRVSSKLQEKVNQLSQELEGSRASYQALDEQTRAVVNGLESERDNLLSEINRLRADASEAASVRTELQRVKAAAEEERAERVQIEVKLAEAEEKVKALEHGTTKQQKTACDAAREAAQEFGNLKQQEARVQEALKAEQQKAMDAQDQLSSANERLALAEVQLKDLSSALERAQFIERQAMERAQEYRTSLQLYREFGNEDFMQEENMFPSPLVEDYNLDDLGHIDTGDQPQYKGDTSRCNSFPSSPSNKNPLSGPLVSVEMDLCGTKATLAIAPWQTRADFDAVVNDFLAEHKVRSVFAPALVRYLEELEANAITFPVHESQNLVDVYSRYS